MGIEDLPKTLIVSVAGDPATPHSGGIGFAETLGGILLTVAGEQHGVAFTDDNACVDNYLINLKLPSEGTTCTL